MASEPISYGAPRRELVGERVAGPAGAGARRVAALDDEAWMMRWKTTPS